MSLLTFKNSNSIEYKKYLFLFCIILYPSSVGYLSPRWSTAHLSWSRSPGPRNRQKRSSPGLPCRWPIRLVRGTQHDPICHNAQETYNSRQRFSGVSSFKSRNHSCGATEKRLGKWSTNIVAGVTRCPLALLVTPHTKQKLSKGDKAQCWGRFCTTGVRSVSTLEELVWIQVRGKREDRVVRLMFGKSFLWKYTTVYGVIFAFYCWKRSFW